MLIASSTELDKRVLLSFNISLDFSDSDPINLAKTGKTKILSS